MKEESSVTNFFNLGDLGFDLHLYYQYYDMEENREKTINNIDLLVTSHELGLNEFKLFSCQKIDEVKDIDRIMECMKESQFD